MTRLFHPASLALFALATMLTIWIRAGTNDCESAAYDAGDLVLFLVSVVAAVGTGFSLERHPSFGGTHRTKSRLRATIASVVAGGAWFLIGGLITLAIGFSHCPLD